MSLRKDDISAIYPASPVQHALLLQNTDREAEDTGLVHVQCELEGILEPASFQAAWDHAFARHEALRATVRLAHKSKPILVVAKQASIELQFINHAHKIEEHETLFDEYRRDDRMLGVDLTTVPIGRIAVFTKSQESHRLLWTSHHATLDGWSAAMVMTEVLSAYEQLRLGRKIELPPPSSLKQYYQWMTKRDDKPSARFWTAYLEGRTSPTVLPKLSGERSQQPDFQRRESVVEQNTIGAVESLARQAQVTPSNLAMSAWAITLAAISGDLDVIFGTVLSGRNADNSGPSSVGMFVNAVPVRVQMQAGQSVERLLRQVKESMDDIHEHQFLALSDIQQRCSKIPGALRAFESLFLFQNFLGQEGLAQESESLSMRGYASGLTSTLPITFCVVPGERWKLTCQYDAKQFACELVDECLRTFVKVLNRLGESADQSIQSVIQAAPWTGERAVSHFAVERRVHRGAVEKERNDTERDLIGLWREGFGMEEISATDDFFELGGHSLLAVILVTEIEKRLGKRVQASELTRAKTIRALAEIIDGVNDASAQRNDANVFVPSGPGDILYYHALAKTIDDGTLSLAGEMRAAKLDVSYTSTTRIEELATRYVREIKAIQPAGPYFLASRLCGTNVSFEVAQQLHSAGEQIAFFAVIEFAPPPLPISTPEVRRRYLSKSLEMVRRGNFFSLAQKVVETLSHRHAAYTERKRRLQTDRAIEAHLDTKPFSYPEAIKYYVPKVYPGRITLFLSKGSASREEGITMERTWRDLAGEGLDVIHTDSERAPDIFKSPHSNLLNECLRVATSTAAARTTPATPEECSTNRVHPGIGQDHPG